MELIEHWGIPGAIAIRRYNYNTLLCVYVNIYKIDLFRNFAEGKF